MWLLLGGVQLLWGACVVGPRGGMRGCSRGACMVAPGGACVVAPGGLPRGGHAWLLGRGMHGCSGGVCVVALGGGHVWLLGGHEWDTTRYGDTVNEQVIRILLECILVGIIN